MFHVSTKKIYAVYLSLPYSAQKDITCKINLLPHNDTKHTYTRHGFDDHKL